MSQITVTNVFEGTHVGQTDLQSIENFLLALLSSFSGSSAPDVSTPGMLYFNSSNGKLYVRDSSDANWRCFFDADNNRIETDKVTENSILDAAVTAAKIGTGAVTVAKIANATLTLAKCNSSMNNAAAGTASLRSFGTTSTTACAGNDSRLSNARTPPSGYITLGVTAPEDAAEDSIVGASWQSIKTFSIYVPSGAGSLQARIWARYNGGNGTRQVRLSGAGATGSGVNVGSSYGWVTASLSPSSTGWQTITIQGYGYSHAYIYVKGFSLAWV